MCLCVTQTQLQRRNTTAATVQLTIEQAGGFLKIDLMEPFNIPSEGLNVLVLCCVLYNLELEWRSFEQSVMQYNVDQMLHDEEPHGPQARDMGYVSGRMEIQ